MLRVGIVGMGLMGQTHAAAWSQTPARVVAVVSSNKTHAGKMNVAHYESLAEMLPQVDVVDICTPTFLHHEQVLEAAFAGKHIVIEKPLALTMVQIHEILAACEKAGVQLLVAHVVRFFPEYATAKSIVARGDIGRVGVVRLQRCSFKPANPDSWFHDVSKSGGMMFDLMIHDYDFARWIAGDVESVFARNIFTNFAAATGDHAQVILKHINGAMSHIEGSWAYPAPMFRTSLEIAGEEGLIEHPAGSSVPLHIQLHKSESNHADVGIPSSPLITDPYTLQIQHFYDVLTGKTKTRVTAADGAAAVQIGLAVIESVRTGRRVMLKEIQ